MKTRPTDDIFRALADGQRRLVVRYLVNDADGSATYREVADALANGDARSTAGTVTLTHTILPMLEETGIVEHDPERERIRYRPNELVEDALRVVDGE